MTGALLGGMLPHTCTKSACLICQEVSLPRGEESDNMDGIYSIPQSRLDNQWVAKLQVMNKYDITYRT